MSAGKSFWRIGGSVAGTAVLGLDSFEGGKIIEALGWASLPDEIRQWGHGIMWSAHHIALWLPFALGLGIILWANWGWLKMKISDRRLRNAAVIALLAISFLVTGQSEGITQTSPPKNQTTAPVLPQSGTVTGQGGNGILNGTQNNYFNAPQNLPPTPQPKQTPKKQKGEFSGFDSGGVYINGGSTNYIGSIQDNRTFGGPTVTLNDTTGNAIGSIQMGNGNGTSGTPGKVPTRIDPYLESLSTKALVELVRDYTRDLRQLEPTLESRVKGFNPDKERKRYERENQIFQKKYKRLGLAIRNELMHRLNLAMTQDIYDKTFCVESGIPHIAGSTPLINLADELNEFATATAKRPKTP